MKLVFLNEYISQGLYPENKEEERYSILKYCKRSTQEIAEIANSLNSSDYIELATFPFDRLTLYETIVSLQAELKIKNEEYLQKLVENAYDITRELCERDWNDQLCAKEEDLKQTIDSQFVLLLDILSLEDRSPGLLFKVELESHKDSVYLKNMKEVYLKISGNLKKNDPNNQIDQEHALSLTRKIVFDRFYNIEIAKEIENLVEQVLPDILEVLNNHARHILDTSEQSLDKLSVHRNINGHSYMIIGAPGSGKDTLMIREEAAKEIDLSDVAKINTDYHRKLLCSREELNEHKNRIVEFSGDESLLVTKRIYKRIEEKIMADEAPNFLINKVYPSEENVKLCTMNGRKLHLYCASSYPEINLSRVENRGKVSGRYVDTQYLLSSDKKISANFFSIILENKESEIDFKLFVNSEFDSYKCIIEGSTCSPRRAVVYDHDLVELFIAKKEINPDTEAAPNETLSKEDVYLQTDSFEQIIIEFENAGFNVIDATIFSWRNKMQKSTLKKPSQDLGEI